MSGRKKAPVTIIGGIAPDHAYSIAEFRAITGMTRQAMSRATKRASHPLIIRDSDPPAILGSDYIEYVQKSPVRPPRYRRPSSEVETSPPATSENL